MKRVRPLTTIRATVDHISVTAENVSLASLTADTGERLTIPAALLPPRTTAGDVLLITIARDSNETAARAARVSELQRKLFG